MTSAITPEQSNSNKAAVATSSLPPKNQILYPDANDEVALTYTAGKKGYITFSLSTVSGITWWKGVKIFRDDSWNQLGILETHDGIHGPVSLTFQTNEFTQLSRVELWKGEFGGSHNDLHHYAFIPADLDGKTVNFLWEKDN